MQMEQFIAGTQQERIHWRNAGRERSIGRIRPRKPPARRQGQRHELGFQPHAFVSQVRMHFLLMRVAQRSTSRSASGGGHGKAGERQTGFGSGLWRKLTFEQTSP